MDRPIKVLLVDDEKRFCETTSKLLTKKGFNPIFALTAEQALQILRQDPQDVVVLDIQMTGMDGHGALTEIKKTDPDLPVIMLTGHGSRYSAMRALVKEAFDYLSKPCDIDVLAARIQDAHRARHHGLKIDTKKALDIMIRIEQLMTIPGNITLRQAMEKISGPGGEREFRPKGIGKSLDPALVFDDRNMLTGVLTRMDVVRAVRPEYVGAAGSSFEDSARFSTIFWGGFFSDRIRAVAEKKVWEIMSELPGVISENANLLEVAHLMQKEPGRLLLVKDISRVIGIIRDQDIFGEITEVMTDKFKGEVK
jgi:CheY-like chemotaxis protein